MGNRSWAIEALRSSLLLYPGEVAFAGSCAFWQSPHVAAAREAMYEIIGALWPSHLVGPYPSLSAMEANLWKVGDVNLVDLTPEYCHQETDNDEKKHSPVSKALAAAGKWASRPNLLWSLFHFVMHNQPAPMPRRAVEAFAGASYPSVGKFLVQRLPRLLYDRRPLCLWYAP